MLSGIFSPLELNVGIICMCMPAFRRFVARFAPPCFGSALQSSAHKYERNEDTPGRRKQDTLGGSLFLSEVVDVVVSASEDRIKLVELGKDGASLGSERRD
jgi:hypothetical protein